jgi:RNA polymerase sigma factor (sigma-70 family)
MKRTHVPLPRDVDRLAAMSAAGSRRAAAELCLRYQPLIRSYARNPRVPRPWREDLEQEAALALLEAARSFQADRDVPFGAWAASAIRRRMIDSAAALRQPRGVPLRVPRGTWSQLASLDRHADSGLSELRISELKRLQDMRAVSPANAEHLHAPDDPAADTLRREADQRVLALLAALPAAQRQALGRYLFGLPATARSVKLRNRALNTLSARLRRVDSERVIR